MTLFLMIHQFFPCTLIIWLICFASKHVYFDFKHPHKYNVKIYLKIFLQWQIQIFFISEIGRFKYGTGTNACENYRARLAQAGKKQTQHCHLCGSTML